MDLDVTDAALASQIANLPAAITVDQLTGFLRALTNPGQPPAVRQTVKAICQEHGIRNIHASLTRVQRTALYAVLRWIADETFGLYVVTGPRGGRISEPYTGRAQANAAAAERAGGSRVVLVMTHLESTC